MYRSVDFLRRKEDEPSMAENWLERTERMLVQMHCTAKEKLECAISLLQDEAYQWWVSVTRTALLLIAPIVGKIIKDNVGDLQVLV